MTKKLTAKTPVSELIKNPKAVEIMLSHGLYCIGCPHSFNENLEQACEGHGIDVNKLLEKLNKRKLSFKKPKVS